jgi:lipopolysaccharide export system protein LptC/lipopolysaccharide export system protein LptA
MVRRLMIATGTLGLILILFGLYRSQNPPPAKPVPALPEITLSPTGGPATQQAISWIRDLRVAPGKQATFEVFDPRGQLQYLMKTAEWKALSENDLMLTGPEVWKFLRNGQAVRVTAAEGRITVEPVGKGNIRPKRGWLYTNVKISIDLTTRQWRQAHPEQEAIEQHPDRVISITTDSLYFDDDLSLIRTEDPVQVHSARFDVASTGLRLIYGRSADRLEHLRLSKSGTITLRGDLDLGEQPRSPGVGTAVRPVAARVSARPAASAIGAASHPLTTAPASMPTKYQDIYKAVFEGPINVRQYRENTLVASLDSDKVLEMVFNMAQQESLAGDQQTKSIPAAGSAEPQLAEESQNRTELTWAGALEITPIQRIPIEQAERTTRVRAVGDRVVLDDKDDGNTITCEQLEYDVIRKSGRIVAKAPAMAKLVDNRGGCLAGQDIRFDQKQRLLQIDGPGQAAEPATSFLSGQAPDTRPAQGPTKIQWSEQLVVRFRPAAMPMPPGVLPIDLPDKPAVMARLSHQTIFQMRRPPRPATSLTGNPLKGLAARSAIIRGDACIERGGETIRAEKLTIGFLAPDGKGRTFGPIESAAGEGAVHLTADDQSIAADSLDVRFAPSGAGHSTPSRAIAQGHATAAQGKARISADFMDATLGQVPREAGRGWELAVPADEKNRPAVVALTASGNVRIADPDQGLEVAGDALTATLPDGRRVKDVNVEGTPAAPARVVMKDYAMTGPQIEGNLESQDIVVPSGGTLKLLVRQGPEGTRLDKPRPLLITWTDRMRMWGDRNQALFEGHVQAIMASTEESGDDTAVTADRMTVYFRAVSEGAEPAEPGQPGTVLELVQKARQEIEQIMPAAAEWLPTARPRRSGRPQFAAVQREPIKILAEGNARAISSRYDATRKLLTSRLLVEGPIFITDLDRQQLQVPGAGRLLIEDYSIAKAAARLASAANPATLPALLGGASEQNLSQTVFAWANGMTFSLDEQLVVFDGQVNMVHRAGSKVVLGTELAQALGAKPALLQVLPGRVATLNCDNLIVEFSEAAEAKDRQEEAPADQWLRRAQLENMIATGSVYLNEELNNGVSNFLTAGRVQYSGQRDTFVIQGARGVPATLIRQTDPQSPPDTTRLAAFWWNRRTGEVSARGIRGQSS